jgi:hypothetical protein
LLRKRVHCRVIAHTKRRRGGVERRRSRGVERRRGVSGLKPWGGRRETPACRTHLPRHGREPDALLPELARSLLDLLLRFEHVVDVAADRVRERVVHRVERVKRLASRRVCERGRGEGGGNA